jgi:hypothetical protein
MNTENEVIKFLVRTFSNIMHFLFVTLINNLLGHILFLLLYYHLEESQFGENFEHHIGLTSTE